MKFYVGCLGCKGRTVDPGVCGAAVETVPEHPYDDVAFDALRGEPRLLD